MGRRGIQVLSKRACSIAATAAPRREFDSSKEYLKSRNACGHRSGIQAWQKHVYVRPGISTLTLESLTSAYTRSRARLRIDVSASFTHSTIIARCRCTAPRSVRAQRSSVFSATYLQSHSLALPRETSPHGCNSPRCSLFRFKVNVFGRFECGEYRHTPRSCSVHSSAEVHRVV